MAPFSWNFPGAYMVQFMTVVASSACIYTMAHFLTTNPDVHFSKELKKDELAESGRWAEQSQVVQRSFFRWIAESRNRDEPAKDTRIWRV